MNPYDLEAMLVEPIARRAAAWNAGHEGRTWGGATHRELSAWFLGFAVACREARG